MYQNITSLWSKDGGGRLLADTRLLELGNIIQSLDVNVDIPKMVVIGTQSSGKSSVLNRILRMDLLPVGRQMVTRTPLHMELNQLKPGSEAYIEFGEYKGGGHAWHVSHNVRISVPSPSKTETDTIVTIIEGETRKLAGVQKNISSSPIIMRIYSPLVPTLTLIDLPGLTSVACKDKGQPADIKAQIAKLATSYIKDKDTLILGVMAARDDLETDMALELIKKYEPEGDRTIGLITKIDLMNSGADVSHYLEGRISRDLCLKYGYFALKNRSPEEREDYTALESTRLETEYFNTHHSVYNKCVDRRGLIQVERVLTDVMTTSIRSNIPAIKKTLDTELVHSRELLTSLGTPIGDSNEERQTLLYYAISTFNRTYNKSLDERGAGYNIGRNIRDIFVNFRGRIYNINPFLDTKLYTDTYITEAIYNCEGNHMPSLSVPVDVLERCMCDSVKRPLQAITKSCDKLCNDVLEQLKGLVVSICSENSLKRFPLVVKVLQERLVYLLNDLTETTREKIYELIQIEGNYIWTDKEEFLKILQNIKYKMDASGTRGVLAAYYKTYVETMGIVVPKLVMYHLVTRSEKLIGESLLHDILKGDLKSLISEPDEIREERKALSGKISRLQRGIKILNEF